jgi:hypothetical protein
LIVDDASNARIRDGIATGTILNDDFGARDGAGGGGGEPRKIPVVAESQPMVRLGPDEPPSASGFVSLSISDHATLEGSRGCAKDLVA